MINISSLANFLSIDAKEIDDISSVTTKNGNFITITLKKKECFCPNCHESHYELKEYYKRKIKHALFLNMPTTFLLKNRRYRCLECGKTFVENNNLAPKKSRVSYETIYIVLEAAKEWNATWKKLVNEDTSVTKQRLIYLIVMLIHREVRCQKYYQSMNAITSINLIKPIPVFSLIF